MKLLIEGYPYRQEDVLEVLDGLFNLQDIEQNVSVNYVGYYYNPHPSVQDMVFILPKVLLDENNKVLGEYDPVDLIHLDESIMLDNQRKFIFEFAVWIHRAIVVYNDSHVNNEIVLHRQIQDEGKGAQKKKSNTFLDVILSLVRFHKENQQFLTFVLKNIHSGFNKINWNKTISRTSPLIANGQPTYLSPINKKRIVNFDEELLIIFYSILNYISLTFGFRIDGRLDYGFKLITGAKFQRYMAGFGKTRLRQIKYKYFSDTAVKLWDLCYAFFDKSYLIRVNQTPKEYILVKSFNIVFEAMIDELIGIPHDQLPKGLADQRDGKVVDHFYTYEGLLFNEKKEDDIYYIGDSKYYKSGNKLEHKSIYKQRTYVRNVIQWNLDIWNDGNPDLNNKFEKIKLFDKDTEGYNVIPNFFISATIDQTTLSYADKTLPHEPQPPLSRHFKNRLYDRDTLLLSHYDVNFLFILALYARNNATAKAVWRENIRKKFRIAIQDMLDKHFEFYALYAHPDVNAEAYFKAHFQDTLGKTFRPYVNQQIYSLALDKGFKEENEKLKKTLSENFYVVKIDIGENPTEKIQNAQKTVRVEASHEGMGCFLFGNIRKLSRSKDGKGMPTKEYLAFANHTATEFVMRSIPTGDISSVRFFVPMYDSGISGYYEITWMSLGERYQELLDKKGNVVYDADLNPIRVPMPCLNLRFGAYTSLGDHIAEVPNFPKWNGQIHSYSEVKALYDDSHASE